MAVQPEHASPEGTPCRVAIGGISGPAAVVPRSAPRLARGRDAAEPATSTAGGPSDAELVQRLGDADGAALSQLYQRFVRPCYSLACRICADGGLAEEVVQEVFLTLWRDPCRFDPSRDGFATWLLTLIHHRAVDAVRRESTIRRRMMAAPEAGENWPPTPVARLPTARCIA